jgi:prophage DNA circulation protein
MIGDHLTRLAAALSDAVDRALVTELAARAGTDAGAAHDGFRIVGESARAAEEFDAICDGADTGSAAHLALAVMAAAVAAGLIAWPDRRRATAARDRLAALSDAATMQAQDAVQLAFVQEFAGSGARLLADRIATLAPIVRVETGVSLPSTVLAFRLYGDAARAGGLVAFGQSMTPFLMPVAFEALSA